MPSPEELEGLLAEADRQRRLDFPPYSQYQEARASVALDGETYALGEVTVSDEVTVPDDRMIRALEEAAAFVLSRAAGLDASDPHGRETPARYIRMLREVTTPEDFVFTTFPAESENMILIRDIPFSSTCKHHIVPFVGYCHVAYVPHELIAGLSKIPRLVKYRARRLHVQESLTAEIANELEEKLVPRGVGVVMEAEHMCMTIRGVQSPGTLTRTAEMRGVFADHSRTAKAEFLGAINGRH